MSCLRENDIGELGRRVCLCESYTTVEFSGTLRQVKMYTNHLGGIIVISILIVNR